MNTRKSLTMVLATLLTALILPAAALALPAVSVECAYNDADTGTDLTCEVWVDTQGDTLRSGGVLVTFNPGILSNATPTRDAAWKFTGPGAPPDGWPYMNPEVGAGTVLFIVGTLDTNDTGLGITGRAKIGDITFTRNATPPAGTAGADQATFFGISVGLGRGGDYVNFVNTAGTNLDAPLPTFAAIAAERGDVDANGIIDVLDIRALRLNLSTPNAPIYMDCDANGIVDVLDTRCLRLKL